MNFLTVHLQFLVGGEKSPSEEKTSLFLLLTSLLHLQHYHTCLQTSLQALMSLLAHSRPGNDRWASALKETFLIIDKCLPQTETGETKDTVDKGGQLKDKNVDIDDQTCHKMDKGEQTGGNLDKGEQNCLEEREDLLERCDVRLLKRLVACVVKTMDLVADMADSPTYHCLPIAVPWKIFYIVIARYVWILYMLCWIQRVLLILLYIVTNCT